MSDESLKPTLEALAALETDLVESMQQAAAKLTKVRSARAILESLTTEEPVEFHGGLADACRAILKTHADRSWSPTEIRDQLKVIGYNNPEHTNLLASIHGVLKRIKESGDADSKEAKDGSGTRYFWKKKPEHTGPPPPLPLSTILDTNAMLRALDSSESMRKVVEQLAAPQTALEQITGLQKAVEQLGGLGKFKALEDQVLASTKALENAGLLPPKKK
jgi:hypothetical protein